MRDTNTRLRAEMEELTAKLQQANAAAAPAEEKTSFALKLESFDAAQKIKVIKEVRAITGLGLKEAKDAVEGSTGAAFAVKKDVSKEEAEEILEKIKKKQVSPLPEAKLPGTDLTTSEFLEAVGADKPKPNLVQRIVESGFFQTVITVAIIAAGFTVGIQM